MESYLSLHLVSYVVACIYDSSFGFFDPHSIPVTDFCFWIVCDENTLTCLFASGAFFVVHLDSKFEHASPADHVVVALLWNAVVLDLASTDEACR